MSDRRIVLCADDYALSHGVCDGILDLIGDGRLSATTAMVTGSEWASRAGDLIALRDRAAIGLHINLTHGTPVGAMAVTAPDGKLPTVQQLSRRAFAGRLDLAEIRAEIDRQCEAYERYAGPPDFVDGHQHVHVLPGLRGVILAALKQRYPKRALLVRDPSDHMSAILKRRTATRKALKVALLSAGYRRQVEAAGFHTNLGFSGCSMFGPGPYAAEFDRNLVDPGPRHLIMCHPGRAEPALVPADPIASRRPQELDALSRREGLDSLLWYPDREITGEKGAFATMVET